MTTIRVDLTDKGDTDMKRIIRAESKLGQRHVSCLSVDFAWDDDYDVNEVENCIEGSIDAAGHECTGIDIHSVDYSDYPEYADTNVSQVTADFSWYGEDYDSDELAQSIDEALYEIGLEPLAISFDSIDQA